MPKDITLFLKNCISPWIGSFVLLLNCFFLMALSASTEDSPSAGMHVFGATDSIREIDVAAVYYLPADVQPLPDWRERVEYHLQRAQKFHAREFSGQSAMQYRIQASPFVASVTRAGFPQDDVNHFYWLIVNEVWNSGKIAFKENCFPVLLVLSDNNFSPGYDDWRRTCSGIGCPFPPPHSQCDGYVKENGEDRPGSRCGGARSAFWQEKHIGLALVSADGWRVPLKGTDCVVYHEGIGHAIGLPHPDPMDDSVMGLAQYADSIEKTWIDWDQKCRMGWQPQDVDHSQLFSTFAVSHSPLKPSGKDAVKIFASLPARIKIAAITAEYQTLLTEPFRSLGAGKIETQNEIQTISWMIPPMALGQSIGYRIRIETTEGEKEEIWNYYKVRK